jgi:hypothetical protein
MIPTAIGDAFGRKNFSKNYGVIMSAMAVCSILQAVLQAVVVDSLGSYEKLFYILGALSFFGAFLAVAYKPPNKGRWFAIWLNYKQ